MAATENTKENKPLTEADFSWDSPDVSFFGVTAEGKMKPTTGGIPNPDSRMKVGVTLDEDGDETELGNDEDVDWSTFGYNEPKEEEDAPEEDEDEEEKPPVAKRKTPLKEEDEDEEEEEEEPAPKKATKGRPSKTANPPDSGNDAVYKLFASELKDRKILRNVEIPDEVGEDDLYQFVDDEIEARLEEALDEYDEALRNNPQAIALLRFMKNGGNTADFVAVYGQSKLPSEADLKKPAVREAFLRQYYMEIEGLDAEDTEDKIEWLKESKKDEKFALKHFKEIQESRAEAQQQLLQAQAERKRQAEASVIQFRNVIKKTVAEEDVIGDIKLSAKDKRELPDYISKHTVKAGPTQLVTQLQKDIADIFGDPKQLILLAKFVNGGMKAQNLEISKASSKVNGVKQTLKDAMEGRSKSQAPGKKSGKSLADAWNSR